MKRISAFILVAAFATHSMVGQAQEDVRTLTLADQQAEAERLVSSVGSSIQRVARLLDETGDAEEERRECLQERLTAMQSLQRIAIEEQTNLNQAVAQSSSAAEHHYNMVLVATQRIQGEETLAQQCTGSLRFAGDTERDFRQDPMIPKADVTEATETPEVFGLDTEGRIESSIFL